MIVWWFYCCIWKGKRAKIAHAIVVEALTTLICNFGLLWLATCEPYATIVGFLYEPKCPTHGHTPNFKEFHCPINTYKDFAGLFFNTNDDTIGNLFSKGSLHSLRSSYFMTIYSLALLIYRITMPLSFLVLAILCGATYTHIMSMATRIIYGSSSMDEFNVLLGVASFLRGFMKMNFSLCIILIEITNNLSSFPQVIMLCCWY